MSEPKEGKSDAAKREEDVLAFWRAHHIFEKSIEKEAPKGDFVFYDGPPFANGLPHYGHILASTIKDAIPRFRTMQGYRVPRQWGWDCHGLPVENLVEKELGFSTKREIEEYGIGKFNAAARKSIMKDVDAWKEIVPRMGRWADMEDDYKTMDATYTESVWWAFSQLWKKGLVEKSFKAMHLCPHCGTTLSNFEVSQGYKDITDISVTVKLKVKDPEKHGLPEHTFFLAWTTTPWTLPGNMAAAVGKETKYAVVKAGEEVYVVAEDLIAKVFTTQPEVTHLKNSLLGADLVGIEYVPPFDYYAKDEKLPNRSNAWKVYAADFVTTTDGTGIVHIAPAFGDDDLALGKKEGLPIVHHVTPEGRFTYEVTDFADLPVKPKGDHQLADIAVIKYLAARHLLFAKEKLVHSYPHCWRCDTPLLNYASSSWFVNVPKIKDQLVAENKKVGWVPESVGAYRFGNWLEGARDWAISRTRFWGAPLPIWESKDGKRLVIGSKEELVAHIKNNGNRYFLMRHGEAEQNVLGLASNDTEGYALTEKGRGQVRASGEKMRGTPVTRIYASPIQRTRETAEIMADALGIPRGEIIFDDRLREFEFGEFNGKPLDDLITWRAAHAYEEAVPGGQSYLDGKRRFGGFLYDIDRLLKDETILIVSHALAVESLRAVIVGADAKESRRIMLSESFPKGTVEELPFTPLPVNADFELDYHRPAIDDVVLVDAEGVEYRRTPEVFDCWFESGAMPFASKHFPFEQGDKTTPQAFPADFIAEGLDQTRGWFYSLIVLGVALFGQSPYKNVIVNGLVLAEDGQKMSKRLKNYPDPLYVTETYGADALRYYLLSSPVVHGEDLNFSERGVQEVASKLIGRLNNVLAFYAMRSASATAGGLRTAVSPHVLDKWIVARLHELVRQSTAGYESYELDVATRPLTAFVDDLSTWYLRRSRDRMKESGEAVATLRYVLAETAKVMAPVTPFFAEHLFRSVRAEEDAESVHLAAWPVAPEQTPADLQLLSDMQETRNIVTLALEQRAKAGIPVRQPLATLSVLSGGRLLDDALLLLVQDEVNVKQVTRVAGMNEMWSVELDTVITPELKEEGMVREARRVIQGARKEASVSPDDIVNSVVLNVPHDDVSLFERNRTELAAIARANDFRIQGRDIPGLGAEISA